MLTFLLAAAVVAPQPGSLRTVRDWIVGCDNGRVCQTVALLPQDGAEGATLALRRGPEANAGPVIWITLRSEGAPSPDWLAIDGRRFALALDDATQALRVSDGAGAARLLGQATRIEALDRGGRILGMVSTRGSAGALLAMDEAQRRLGTTGALVRRGSATRVPPAPALPVITTVRPRRRLEPLRLSAARTAALRERNRCDAGLDARDYPVESRQLDARTSLVLIPCYQGAYNGTSLVLVARHHDGRDLHPALFDYNASAGERNGADVPPDGPYWNETSERLESGFKGRGVGDCGSRESWAWDGVRFRLIELTAMGECRGSTDYITTWRTRVVAH